MARNGEMRKNNPSLDPSQKEVVEARGVCLFRLSLDLRLWPAKLQHRQSHFVALSSRLHCQAHVARLGEEEVDLRYGG